MAEETQTETVEEVENEQVDTQDTTEQPEAKQETFTKEQMEDIIKQRVAREKKAAEKAVQEAEKLAKMNEEERKQHEFEKLKQELDEYKKKDTYYSLSKEATKMLSDHNIPADDEVFDVVVKDNAEETKERVEWFSGLVNRLVEDGVKKALSGNSPRVHTNAGKSLTKEDILNEKDATKRIKMIQDNPNLFK